VHWVLQKVARRIVHRRGKSAAASLRQRNSAPFTKRTLCTVRPAPSGYSVEECSLKENDMGHCGLIATVVGAIGLSMGPSAVAAGIVDLGRNERAPDGFYGPCGNPQADPGNSFSSKAIMVRYAGRDPALAQFIDVLQCKAFTGGGGSRVVSCEGSPYDYCVLNDNDGLGNHILLGVVLDKQPPVCQLVGSRQTPMAQLDVKITDKAAGLQAVEFRGGLSNVQYGAYYHDAKSVVLSFTKIVPSQPAVVGPMAVYDMAGNTANCERYEF
jgi:hypothetical protein